MPALFLPATSLVSLSRNRARRSAHLRSKSSLASCSCRFAFSLPFLVFSLTTCEKSRLPMIVPEREGEAFREASFTSPALSPKMARSSFSSGEGSLSPFGVILPMRMSPGSTWAPMRMIPFLSRSLVASSLTFGISAVSSSMPRLVSRTSMMYSSTWMEVKISSRMMRSESTMASSKL